MKLYVVEEYSEEYGNRAFVVAAESEEDLIEAIKGCEESALTLLENTDKMRVNSYVDYGEEKRIVELGWCENGHTFTDVTHYIYRLHRVWSKGGFVKTYVTK